MDGIAYGGGQAHRIGSAHYVGEPKDFSNGTARPLGDPALFEDTHSQNAA